MAANDCNLNLYKPPSNGVLHHRKEFYDLWRRCDDQTATWLKRIQSQIKRCEFPSLITYEYLLIDKFVCELNPNARDFIQSIEAWTLEKLNECFIDQNIATDNRVNVNISIDSSIDQTDQQIPSTSPKRTTPRNGIKHEIVSDSNEVCSLIFVYLKLKL